MAFRGSGLILPYYKIDDLYVVLLFSRSEEGEFEDLLGFDLCDSNGILRKVTWE